MFMKAAFPRLHDRMQAVTIAVQVSQACVSAAYATLISLLQVHTWCGDIIDLAATVAPLGSVDAILFKSSFAHMHDQHEALGACCRMLRPGGHIVISHPRGR